MLGRTRSGMPFRLAFALLLVCVMCGVAFAGDTTLKVTANSAWIRSAPDPSSPTLVSVSAGTFLLSSSKEGPWYKVTLPPDSSGRTGTGYIHELVVTVVTAQPAQAEAAPTRAPEPARERAVAQEPPQSPLPVRTSGFEDGPKPLQFRFYGKGGALLKGPSAADLDFVAVGGESMDKYLTLNKGHFGAGLQMLFASSKRPGLKFGADIGFQKLVTAKFDTGVGGGSVIYTDYWDEKEYGASFMGLVERQAPGSRLILQGGLGMHYVFWSSTHHFESRFTPREDKTESGSGTSIGLMAAAGTHLATSARMSMPVLVRLDYVVRYKGFVIFSVMAGVTLH